MNWKYLLERLLWLTILGVITGVSGSALLDVEVWKAAALAGAQSALGFIDLVARWRLRFLPDPGKELADQVRAQTTENIHEYLSEFPTAPKKAVRKSSS